MEEIKVKIIEGTINMLSDSVEMEYNEKTFTSAKALAKYFTDCGNGRFTNYIEEAKKDIKLLQTNGYFIFYGRYGTYAFIKA